MEQHEAESAIDGFLRTLRDPGGLEFEYEMRSVERTGEGDRPRLEVELSGPDAERMVERNGELLHAMESLAASILRLGPEEQELLQFDALGFKGGRQEAIERLAAEGVAQVRETGHPYVFAPMNSRERRMLHLALAASGLATASSDEGLRRFVVAYPEGMTPKPEQFAPASIPPRVGGVRGQFGDRGRSGGFRGAGRRGGRPSVGPGRGEERRPVEGSEPTERVILPGERLQRLDPNGNPIEAPEPADGAAALSEQQRLESLRRAFRKR